jgi:hypothetical protein
MQPLLLSRQVRLTRILFCMHRNLEI